MNEPVLFVSHDATRTGAPIALLNLLPHLQRLGLPFEVLLRGGGELSARFRAIAPVTEWAGERAGQTSSTSPGVAARLAGLWSPRRSRSVEAATEAASSAALEYFRGRNVSLIYSNTITNGEILHALSPLGVPVITHVHELEYWITHRMSQAHLEQVRSHTTLYVAASHAVARCLSDLLHVPNDRIVTIHESIDPIEPPGNARAESRASWGIPEDAFVAGLGGTMDWRKGVDLLPALALEVARQSPARKIHWVWVGGEHDGSRAARLRYDFRRVGCDERLHLTGTLDCARQAFAGFDGFVVLSREDAFPLVMLEAASLGIPVICFDGAGGAPEFVRDDAGFVVPYLDLPSMAARLIDLADSPGLAQRLGRTGSQRVLSHHNAAAVAPKLIELIHEVRSGVRQ
jgi:glycosyltransferase involved in cell wall biosynthesis